MRLPASVVGSLIAVGVSLAGAQDTSMVWKQDFEDPALTPAVEWFGVHATDKTFSASKGALKSIKLSDADKDWTGAKVRYHGGKGPTFTVTDKSALTCCYFVTLSEKIVFYLHTDDKNVGAVSHRLDKPVPNQWNVFTLPVSSLKSKGGGAAPAGANVRAISVFAGAPNSNIELWIDNLVITDGPIPADLAMWITLKKEEAEARIKVLAAERTAQTLTLADDRAHCAPEVILNLKRTYRLDAVDARTILNVGADAANASGHWTPLLRKELAGYKLLEKYVATMSGGDLGTLKDRAQRAYTKHRPEAVTILPGSADLAMNRAAPDIANDAAALIDSVLAAGSVPILYTPGVAATGSFAANKACADLAASMRQLAVLKRVPLVDAFEILNPGGRSDARMVSGPGPSMAGHEELNRISLKVYRLLETWVFVRKALEAAEHSAEASARKSDARPAPAPAKKSSREEDPD